ncbi:MAG: ACT domain-containing protein [Candidatus Diapherotrites archaeon]
MSAIKDLKLLLKSMNPELSGGEFVFCSVSDNALAELNEKPLLVFREKEWATVVLEREAAERHSLAFSGSLALITLNVHSDLSAVGFLAAVTARLAEHEISVNVVSAFHHDHLFVPAEKAEEAMRLLKELQESKA